MKNIVAKTWQRADEDGYRYSGPPQDVTAPVAAVLGTPVSLSASRIRWPITTPATDNQTGVNYYTLYTSTSEGGTYTAGTPIARDVAEANGCEASGLTASTTYYGYVTATDLADPANTSVASNITSGATQASSPNTSWWRNWPIMRVSWCQGQMAYFLSSNSTVREDFARKDIIIPAWFYPTNSRLSTRMTGLDWINDLANPPRMLSYCIANEHYITADPPQNDPREILLEIIDSAVEGNSNWRSKRVSGANVRCEFNPSLAWQTNLSSYAGLNSRGETIQQAFARELDERFNGGTPANYFDTYFSGWAIDVLEHRIPSTFIESSPGVYTSVSDIDYDQNGVAESRWDFSSATTAGGRLWSEGTHRMKAAMEARFTNSILLPNAGRWAYDYFSSLPSRPPLPMSQHPSYRKWEVIMQESVNNELGWARVPGGGSPTGTYTKSNGVSFTTFCTRIAIQQRFLKPDSEIASHASGVGRGAVVLHAWMHIRGTSASPVQPNATDRELHRFHLGCALLHDRVAIGLTVQSQMAPSLDEELLGLGNPVGTRSMGTLNETTVAFTLRTPDATNGTATMHCQRYDNFLVCVRTDTPPAGTALWDGSGSAVAFTLPTPPTGKKYRFFDSGTYDPPNETFAMRDTDPTINNGADTGATISLRYWTARFLEIVDA